MIQGAIFVKKNESVDYQATLNQFRKEEHMPANPVYGSTLPEKSPLIDGYVDYQAAARA